MENLRIQLKVDDADVENVDMVRRNQELANANPVPKKVGEAADVGEGVREVVKRGASVVVRRVRNPVEANLVLKGKGEEGIVWDTMMKNK